jgi:hypothetical protein
MNKFILIGLILSVTAVVLVVLHWASPSEITHYTAEQLVELTCEELGERHEEVIFAYHDAEIAHYRQAGAFHDDLGIPPENVVPYAVLMERFVRDNNISKADIATGPSPTPFLNTRFFYETTGICAVNPSWQAVEALRQAAINLGLIN